MPVNGMPYSIVYIWDGSLSRTMRPNSLRIVEGNK
jgi:hypothetical protein